MKTYYIGADVHKQTTTLAVRHKKEIIKVVTVKTEIDPIVEFLGTYKGRKLLTFEETSLSAWLYAHLHDKVDTLTVCDPRRNKLISDGGDKSDRVDARALAELLENNSVQEIHHTDNKMHINLKQWLALYHDRVQNKVRQHHKITAQALKQGAKVPAVIISNRKKRTEWLNDQSNETLTEQLQILFNSYDQATAEVTQIRTRIDTLSQSFPIITKWQKLAGIGLIRAASFYAYIETPWRFKSKSKLAKYCGLGLECSQSGSDKNGRPKPARLRMPLRCNRVLKNALLGAAQSIVQARDNVFKHEYERMVFNGVTSKNALHAIARKLLFVMWGMWKNNRSFDPKLWQIQHQID
jgi:transposase